VIGGKIGEGFGDNCEDEGADIGEPYSLIYSTIFLRGEAVLMLKLKLMVYVVLRRVCASPGDRPAHRGGPALATAPRPARSAGPPTRPPSGDQMGRKRLCWRCDFYPGSIVC